MGCDSSRHLPVKPHAHALQLAERPGRWFCNSCGRRSYAHHDMCDTRYLCPQGCDYDLCIGCWDELARHSSPFGAALPPLPPPDELPPSLPSVLPASVSLAPAARLGLDTGVASRVSRQSREAVLPEESCDTFESMGSVRFCGQAGAMGASSTSFASSAHWKAEGLQQGDWQGASNRSFGILPCITEVAPLLNFQEEPPPRDVADGERAGLTKHPTSFLQALSALVVLVCPACGGRAAAVSADAARRSSF